MSLTKSGIFSSEDSLAKSSHKVVVFGENAIGFDEDYSVLSNVYQGVILDTLDNLSDDQVIEALKSAELDGVNEVTLVHTGSYESRKYRKLLKWLLNKPLGEVEILIIDLIKLVSKHKPMVSTNRTMDGEPHRERYSFEDLKEANLGNLG